ncbi:uncharacterized protein LOC132309102 [Cornus florida]|uniref:uncharacterized protein LOC132309102 n=1 Tax=Cornus florida TaxID=4283 RepID=UPI0028A022A7|nr:uncharacterized protein LOC132309102 [Cornus florida]
MHCRNEDFVPKVYSFFAKPIYMDDPNSHRDKGQFVRVMVEVEVKEVLPDSMVIDVHGINCHVAFDEERCPLKVTQHKAKPKKVVDCWVIKHKGKMIEDKDVDQVLVDFPVRRVQKEVAVPTSNSFALLEDNEGINVVETPVEVVNKEKSIYITGVYAANRVKDRRELWQTLKLHVEITSGPWIALGDWNIIKCSHEKKGGLQVPQSRLDEFNSLIYDIRMEDIPINNAWLQQFNDSKVSLTPASLSDHCVENIIGKTWEILVTGSPLHILQKKLRAVKAAVKEWNKDRGTVSESIQVARAELHSVQMELLQGPETPDCIARERFLTGKLQNALDLEEIYWAQKSRVKWLQEGDKCTAFFHNVFYEDLYKKHGEVDVELRAPKKVLNEKDNQSLDCAISKEEIKRVVMHFHPDKAPDLDGFPARFYQHFWRVIGQDVINAVSHFVTKSTLPQGINSTFLTLIPKANHGDNIANYRPIALCNLVYKIISKILANRLSSVLPNIIGPEQVAFIKGRKLHDNILLVSDLIKGFGKKHGDLTIVLKVDLQKAFDSVDWDFLQRVLRWHGFSDKWIKWISVCTTSPKFSILCNGVPAGYFSASRGIRQGCPLSPLLFSFVTEFFSNLIENAIAEGRIKVSKAVSQGNLKISHAFYADDLLMVVKTDIPTIKAIDVVFKQFTKATDLQVNKEKNTVIFSKQIDRQTSLAELIVNGKWEKPVYFPERVFSVIQRLKIIPGSDIIGWKDGGFSLKAA